MPAIDDFKKFIVDIEGSNAYKNWARDNPVELSRWTTFKNVVLAGNSLLPPTMVTAFGKALIDEAVETEHYRLLEQPTTPPIPPTVKTNSLAANTILSGIYQWQVTTNGDCASIEYWATPIGGVPVKLGTTTTGTFALDTTQLTNGPYLFGVVLVDSQGNRYPDTNRVIAAIHNLKPTVVLSGKTAVGEKLIGTIKVG